MHTHTAREARRLFRRQRGNAARAQGLYGAGLVAADQYPEADPDGQRRRDRGAPEERRQMRSAAGRFLACGFAGRGASGEVRNLVGREGRCPHDLGQRLPRQVEVIR